MFSSLGVVHIYRNVLPVSRVQEEVFRYCYCVKIGRFVWLWQNNDLKCVCVKM